MNLLTKSNIGLLELRLNVSCRWKFFEGSIMDIELPFDFKEFLKLLNGNGVRYLLIGGYAVGCHGYPRAMIGRFGSPSIQTMLNELCMHCRNLDSTIQN